MKRATVLVAAGVVLMTGFWGAVFAQTSAPSMPANWQALSFGRLVTLADGLQKAGKSADAKQVMEVAGGKVDTVAQCKGMESLAKSALGQDSNTFLAKALAERCMADFAKVGWGSEYCYWGIDTLISGGKLEQAKSLLASTLAVIPSDFSKVYSRAKQVMSADDAGKWFSDQVVARCQAWGRGSAALGILFVAGELVADGKPAEAKKVLDAGGTHFKTIRDCASINDTAKAVMKDQANVWLAGILLQNCQADVPNASIAQLKWALGVLVGAGKKEEAKPFLEAAGKLAKTPAECDSLKGSASAILGAGADQWMAALLVRNGQATQDKGSFSQLKSAADELVAAGKKDQAKAFLDLAGKAAKTLEACKSLSNSSKAVYGADSDKFLAGVLAGGCMEDFANPNVHWGSDLAYWAIDVLIAGGKTDEAKQVLASTSQNITDKFIQVYSRAKLLLPPEGEAAKWLSDQVATRCQGGWKVGTPTHILPGLATMLAGEGKLTEAKKVLDAGAGFFKTLRDCGDLQDAAKLVMKDQAPVWMADVLLKNCQGDLGNCSFLQLANALQTLVSGGKKAEAKPFLDAAGRLAKTVGDCETLKAPAKAILGDAADAWIAATLQKCTPTSGKSGLSELNAAVGMLLAGGKKDEAKAMLETAGKSVKTVAECMAIGSSAKAAMGDGTDPWLAGILLQNCQADLPKCDFTQAKWAVGVLAAGGKKAEAQPFLDAAGALVKTIADCESLRVPARALLGETAAGAWLANVLLRNCQADLDRAGSMQIRAALNSLVAAGKKAEARPFLDAAGKAVRTVADCQSLTDSAKGVLAEASNGWLAGVLLQNCQADLPKCTLVQARWALGVLLVAGKKAEAKPFLEAAGKAVKTLAECDSLKEQAKAIMGADGSPWLAGILLQNCQAELAKGNLSQLESSISILLSAGKKDEAKSLLDSAGKQVKTVAEWSSLSESARTAMGDGAGAWLADVLLKNCQLDLPKCTLIQLKPALMVLTAAGKKAEAKPFLDAAGKLTKTMGDCESLQEPARAVLGEGACNPWLADCALGCQADLGKCTLGQARWATGVLVAAGKKEEAKPFLEAAGKLVKTGADCGSLKESAKAILGAEAGMWLATVLVQNCQADLAKCSFAQLKEATDALVAGGKKDQAKVLLDLAGKAVKTLDACKSLSDSAKVVYGADSNAFLAGLLAGGCMEDFSNPNVHWGSDLAYWAIDAMIAGGKTDQAKQVLASTVQHIPDKFSQAYSRIKLLLPDGEAAKWLSDQVATRCQAGWKEGVPAHVLPGLAAMLAGEGRLAEAKKVLEAGSVCFKTVRDCQELQDVAKLVMKDQASAWLVDVLLKNCQADLEQCPSTGAAWALNLLIPAGKTQEAKAVLQKAGARASTVAGCQSLENAANALMMDKAGDWLAQVLVDRCQVDFTKCDLKAAVWAAKVLQKAGKAQEAKILQDAMKRKVSAVGQVRFMAQGLDESDSAARRALADLLSSSCQDDLAQCGLGDAAWAASVLAEAGRLAKAKELLAQIEAGQRAASSEESPWEASHFAAHAYMLLGQGAKAQEWATRAVDAAVGTEDLRRTVDSDALLKLAGLLRATGLTGRGRGYSGLAAGIVSAATNNKIKRSHVDCATSMSTIADAILSPESQKILEQALTDQQGTVRHGVARILTWSHVRCGIGEAKAWKTFLGQKLADASIQGDARAQWLVARAYAESASLVAFDPFAGIKWMNEALATASSPQAKLYVVEQIVMAHEDVMEVNKAVSLLDSLSGQFSDGAAAEAFDALRRQTAGRKEGFAMMVRQEATRQKAAATDSYRNELRKRMEVARGRGDREETARYEKLLASESGGQ